MTPVKFPQADGRGIVPRKWSCLKTAGPLVVFCERVLKRMIQHGWPCGYICAPTNERFPTAARWGNSLGDTARFRAALRTIVKITASALRLAVKGVAFYLLSDDLVLTLVGDWEVVLHWGSGAKPDHFTLRRVPPPLRWKFRLRASRAVRAVPP